ncbi:putative acyl-CoA dehydrogenase [Syntrophobacter sp. SbD1]|nr:putative acyl-CoA dehydrogenase [Syntrophobacter sp. SbD1]
MTELSEGGGFLLQPTSAESVFTPEDFNEEHRMIARTVSRFVDEKILPVMDELESQKEGLLGSLMREAGELGILGAEVPSEYDGTELDKICSTIIAEEMGRAGSFAMAHGAQAGIGSLPIVFFGTDEQRRKYLPGLVSGEKIAAYALTEPGSGSDAMAAKTKAFLSPEGNCFVLNGTKQFITNAGLADIFIVYAKLDDKISAFIVDAHSEGLSTGLEEKKMGIKGSSTRCVFFDNVKVPVENLLFEAGRGHIVAFNILNMGRYKLAANSIGHSKLALKISAAYANERVQFNVPIARFGLIKEKIAEMAMRTYAAESSVYRTGGLIEETLRDMDASGSEGRQAVARAMEKYAIECSINKVFATEAVAYVVDEGVQIHGGYGFISEYPIERLYRDARIYRIFEGTNEINRILIPTMLVRRGLAGGLPLLEAAEKLALRLEGTERLPLLENAEQLVQAAKDLFLFTLGVGRKICGDAILKRQEILGRLADLAIGAFVMESALLRAQKAMEQNGESGAARKMNMADAFIYSHFPKLGLLAGEVLPELAQGEELKMLQARLAEFLQYRPINVIGLRNKIADQVLAAAEYIV